MITMSMRNIIRVAWTVSLIFTFADKDGIIADTVKGINGASAYGKSLVNTQELYGSYSDTYIDAPFTPIMIWRGAQVIIPAIIVKRRQSLEMQ